MAWIWAAFSAILFLYLLQKLLSPKMKKKFPPGPIGLPIFGHFHLMSKNPHRDLYNLAQKYSAIMGLRFGFVPTVVVSSPATANLFLKTHDLVFASRPKSHAVMYLVYGQRGIVFSPYNQYWRNMRKLCTLELLSNARINQFRAMRKSEVELMVNSLKLASEKGETVDLSAQVVALNRDMTCLMVFGRKYNDGDFDEKGFKAVIVETMETIARFNIADFFPYIGNLDLQGLNQKMKDLSMIFDGFLEKIIDEHVKEKKEDEDIVDTLMAIMESGEAEFEFDRRHVKGVLLDLLLAGMDTSATTTEWALSELVRHPKVMNKLQKELESVVGLNHMVEESHLDKLKYLDCVVKETLRLHPVAPLLIPHESMEECVINGFYIPKKSRIMVNVWAIGRDPSAWPDPETFLPERFIGSNIDLRGHDFELLPFGSGRRGCPGLQLGLTMVQLVLAQLIHCFNWKLPTGGKHCDLDMSEHFGLVMTREKHLEGIPSYRLDK